MAFTDPKSALQGAMTFAASPQAIIFAPLLSLAGYGAAGLIGLIVVACLVPAAASLARLLATGTILAGRRDPTTLLPMRETAQRMLSGPAGRPGADRSIACIVVSIDAMEEVEDRFGTRAVGILMQRSAQRLARNLRTSDLLVRLEGYGFGIVLRNLRRADTEMLMQISGRLQRVVSEPLELGGNRIFPSASIGFSLPPRSDRAPGPDLLEAAELACEEAGLAGPGTTRAFSEAMRRRKVVQTALIADIDKGLDLGEIVPWYQPQIVAETGKVLGFEALARWRSPGRGLLMPNEFLPAIEAAGLTEKLGEIVLCHALGALRGWDRAGHPGLSVAINFSGADLRSPHLVDRIRWELDRFSLTAERIRIEVLETVTMSAENDAAVRNLRALSKLGCRIDLDDFGTGNASIANVRRFPVDRIKIDKSFVRNVDRDTEQHNFVAAILTMCERLGIEALAEGVETGSEIAILAQLGCHAVQGFEVGRPMPLEQTEAWLQSQQCRQADLGGLNGPPIGPAASRLTGNSGKTA